MKGSSIGMAFAAMDHNQRIWDDACNAIEDLVRYKNGYLWLENPDGNTCMIKVGTKLLTSEGEVFEITENTEMKTAEIVPIVLEKE